MGIRRRSRELALQLLFQSEFTPKIPPSEMVARFADDFKVESGVQEYAVQLVEGIFSNRAEVDALIQGRSSHWKVERMALVDINVMRIAVFEMRFMQPPVPPNVAINEAIEIAKKYGTTDSGAFVNGILDNIAKIK